MRRLHLDYETYSEVDIKSAGAHKYAMHPSTEVLMLGWAFDDDPVQLWVPSEAPMPFELAAGLRDSTVVKIAFNAAFERLITKYVLDIDIPLDQWRCTMVASYYLGFSGGLDQVTKAIGLPCKDARGQRLINTFSKPAPSNHKAVRYTKENKPEEWAEFCEYCVQDVVVERQLWHWLMRYPAMPTWDWGRYQLDQKINDRGVPIALDLAYGAMEMWEEEKERLELKLRQLTGLSKVTRGPFLEWLARNNCPADDARKETLKELMSLPLPPPHVKEALYTWLQKESRAVSKYSAAVKGTCDDNRARGMFQFKGASRTDRTSGRRLQLQNLKQSYCELEWIPALVHCIERKSHGGLSVVSGMPIADALGGAVRHLLCASKGKVLVVCDLTSIESVILGWLTYCSLIDETFRTGRDSYKVFASRYFNVPYDHVTKEQRKFSKPPVLGCFAEDTLVLTNEGWVPIVYIRDQHKVWDGVEWVPCDGSVYQGKKDVIERFGVRATPDHKVLIEGEWEEWKDLTEENIEGAILSGHGLCCVTTGSTRDIYADALAEQKEPLQLQTLHTVRVSPAYRAQTEESQIKVNAKVPTYDVLNAGPRNRFTILTTEGAVVVHNCGYMLGWRGLSAYAKGYGVEMDEASARNAVDTFRGMYPEIPQFWKWIDNAVKHVIRTGERVEGYRLLVERDQDFLRIWLPSGRALSYYKPEIRQRPAPWDAAKLIDNVSYMGSNDAGQWVRIFAHAGLFTENIVQSIAMDVLFNGLTEADKYGMSPVIQVHDEIGCEEDEADAEQKLELLRSCMTTQPVWAPDLWLGADGYISKYYMKD